MNFIQIWRTTLGYLPDLLIPELKYNKNMKNKWNKYWAIFGLSLIIPALAFWIYNLLWNLGVKLPANRLFLELEFNYFERLLWEIGLFVGLPILAVIISIALRKYKNPIIDWTIVAAIFLLFLALIFISCII